MENDYCPNCGMAMKTNPSLEELASRVKALEDFVGYVYVNVASGTVLVGRDGPCKLQPPEPPTEEHDAK